MSSPYMQKIPKPDPTEFEMIAKVFLNHRYTAYFQKFGRPGQAQHGIDLYCADNIVAQCKDYLKKKLTPAIIDEEIEKAEQFFSPFIEFAFVTAIETDATLQSYILKKNTSYQISIYFWDDIEGFLNENPEIKHQFYPEDYNPTERYIASFLETCQRNHLYDFVSKNDFLSPFVDDGIIDLDVCLEELRSFYFGQYSRNVSANVLSDAKSLIDALNCLLSLISALYTSDGVRSVPIYQVIPEDKQQGLFNSRKTICDVYLKYQLPTVQ